MDIQQALTNSQEALNARPVFGEPIRLDGVTLITAAVVRGGGGGRDRGDRARGGFGVRVKPAGAFVVNAGKVHWRLAIDVNRIIWGAQLVAGTVFLTLALLLRGKRQRARRLWR